MDKKLATAAHPTAAASAPTARSATADGARAAALLSGQPAATPANTPAKDAANSSGRYVVQVGAFADTHRANEVRTKLEAAKLKTYTHVADTKDGKRTRVRLGPFDTRAEADKAAARVKKLNLPAAVLVL
jgi:DedD protein